MTYRTTPAFFTRPYTIHCDSGAVDIEPYDKWYQYPLDFLGDWAWKVAVYSVIAIILFALLNVVVRVSMSVLFYVWAFFIVFFFLFNLLYVFTNHKWVREMQMHLEEPVNFLMNPKWETLTFRVVNTQKVEVRMQDYTKFQLNIDNGTELELIKYDMIKTSVIGENRRILSIIFTKPVDRTITLRFRANLRRIDTYEHKDDMFPTGIPTFI